MDENIKDINVDTFLDLQDRTYSTHAALPVT